MQALEGDASASDTAVSGFLMNREPAVRVRVSLAQIASEAFTVPVAASGSLSKHIRLGWQRDVFGHCP